MRILFSLIIALFTNSSLAQTESIDNSKKLDFTVAFFNKKITKHEDLVFILKIKNISKETQYIPSDYYFSVKGGLFGNIEYEIEYCSPDTGRKIAIRKPLIGGIQDIIESDSFNLKRGKEFLINTYVLEDYFYRVGTYKIRFYFVNKSAYFLTIPGLKTDWIYFDVETRLNNMLDFLLKSKAKSN